MQQPDIIPHLFRTEFRKITAVLTRLFGIANITLAEDIAAETFVAALENWPYNGVPENPVAWLYAVAKNKAKNLLARHQIFDDKIVPFFKSGGNEEFGPDFEPDLSPQNIHDSQLQMLFAVCNPVISAEAQVGLALRILCGFGIDEIANAFLSNKETINKRLYRAKERLRKKRVVMEFPAEKELQSRLQTVLTTLYLLYSEGYYSESSDAVLREDLCLEAMRLTAMLMEYPLTNLPDVKALFALMCFQASRFKARSNERGEMVLYEDQDRTCWDGELVAKGACYLNMASTGNKLSKYHLEAGIAYWHTIRDDNPEKWESILHLFNQLLTLEYSPVAALNRTYALAKVKGNEAAIEAAEKLKLTNNHYYFTLLGELYKSIDQAKSLENFRQALGLAKTPADKQLILSKISRLEAV